ncbi:MAG: cytochrome c1 [Alphaproteobacteria bacterium]|nr:cytochrome c1 [Alphaproteobacteria bacterium]
MKHLRSLSIASLSTLALAGAALAAGNQMPLKHIDWTFDGMFGTVDRQSAQRGLQVYKEVCAACHSLNHVAYRSLQDLGFSEAEVKAFAAQKEVTDGPNDAGEMFQRPARPSDHFVSPYPNEKAARAANGGAYPPDLSLIVKARPDGANYLYSLLTGYTSPPADVKIQDGLNYNPYFPGGQVAMPAPLSDGQVSYVDGTTASVDQMSRDVVNFLQWAAEPEMEARKRMGLKALLFLGIFTVLAYIAKRRVWAKVEH